MNPSNQKLHKLLPLIRYLIAGGSAFVTEYGSFYVLYSVFHVQLYVANSISFGLGLLVSFSLNRGWAFKTESFKRHKHHQFAIYFTLALINLFITNIIIGILKHHGIDPRVGKILCMFLIICWNFVIFKKVIFAKIHELPPI